MDIKLIESKTVDELNEKLDLIIDFLKQKVEPKESEWMDLADVAQALKVTKRSVFNYINEGKLSFSHLAGHRKLFFKRDDVNKMISDHYIKSFRTK